MKNKLLLGIVLGFGAWYLLSMTKKPCPCKDVVDDDDDSQEENLKSSIQTDIQDTSECEKAVDLVMSELRKTSKMSEKAFAYRRGQELEKCISMSY